MNSVRHTWRQQISTNKNEEKENGYLQEPNTTATYLQKVVLIVKDVFSYEICRPHNFFEYGNELFPKLALC